ncbi:MAG: hypothetical protein SFV51_17025 [Bryobacteraceae bacterium]|nr:hypothetical protein [Bryobacteraceae bacterium]
MISTICLACFLASAAAQECSLLPVTPAQPAPKVEEGERATESETFQTTAFALSPSGLPHFYDSASRIRRIGPDGRITTLAGNGVRGETLEPGPALEAALPAITQLAFSPSGVLHFAAQGRVFRLNGAIIEAVAGSGRAGFNGESGAALEINLGGIVNLAFERDGGLLLIDGFNRVRRLDSDGIVRTVAGSVLTAATNGFTGDNGPATAAALSNPRQVIPLPDGAFWVKDLGGRHLRVVTPDGLIRTMNSNFEAAVNIVMFPDGTPGAATANRLYPIGSNGAIETGGARFPPFTGTPLAVDSQGALYFLGSARPEQRNPLVRLLNRTQTVVAGAPVAAIVDGQAPPFGIWRNGSLLYAASLGGKAGILEARPGQAPRFVAGGGADIGDAEGKDATSLTFFGIVAFSVDGEGRIIAADVYRRRILVVDNTGKTSVLKAGGEPIVYAPLGSLSNLQRIAADGPGNIYWYARGATPAGGVFTADIAVWNRADSTVSSFRVTGLAALTRLEDGSAAVLAGNGVNFRTAYRISPAGLGDPLPAFRMLPLQSVTRYDGEAYFTAASRLFRGEPGRLRMLEAPPIPIGAAFVPDFVLASSQGLLLHLSDGGFYRIQNPDACRWSPQPAIASVVNAASFEFPNIMAPRQLLTIFGSGLGPDQGQGIALDGALRAGAQPAPYPTLLLGNFSGANPNATLTGTPLPVIHSSPGQMTVQALSATPASRQYLLYFGWQGLQLIHATPISVQQAAPGLFAADGLAVAINEDGSRHSTENPAAAGSLIQLFGTGFGAINGALANGEFATAPLPVSAPVTVTIGGEEAEVEFAGAAPGLIGGVYRLEVRVPDTLDTGAHPVTVQVEGQTVRSTRRASIAVRK